MYKAYEAKRDSPFLRALIYISILEMFILVIFFIYVEKIIFILSDGIEFNVEKSVYIWLVSGFILLFNYFFYSRLNIDELERRFEGSVRLNDYVKLWMLILLPFVILFGGIIIYVFMFGGVILGKTIIGFF